MSVTVAADVGCPFEGAAVMVLGFVMVLASRRPCEKKQTLTKSQSNKFDDFGFSLLPNVLGPKYE